ncbi:hypothetical protein EEL32_16785 [Brevibacillus laterosporus]|uniref:Uncharacterized protein n=1 Tax=Brevibacillus laterosporus TaxID=1465 RepID=A0A502IER7_BRELA|nr:hypothetical protein [Brevibacillus laterosporus]QDX91521.1 hypothetical protein EEL30_03520 [Brevibacillus laterosporus]RAP28463.1 hypothetical protein C2W64_04898 [Brevibacillus laterosporus]TPG69891.1 hypothetical protein EEL31_16310 [Brevibacillus laterosporus]TPG84172.1 hypothetical protein EEL32_16785 [Brevibacillus laterosporus]
MQEQLFLIYQESSEDECLLTIQPYQTSEELAEAISRLEHQDITEYTIIKGKKMKAKMRVMIDLTEDVGKDLKEDEHHESNEEKDLD